MPKSFAVPAHDLELWPLKPVGERKNPKKVHHKLRFRPANLHGHPNERARSLRNKILQQGESGSQPASAGRYRTALLDTMLLEKLPGQNFLCSLAERGYGSLHADGL
jgi:hypothetical protein